MLWLTLVGANQLSVAHPYWTACLYGAVYNFGREDYSGREMLHWEMYVAALFWAVQTLTTVERCRLTWG